MEMKLRQEEEKAKQEAEKFFLEYLSTMFAQAPQQGEKAEFSSARKQFFDSIKPKSTEKKKKLEWNIPQEAIDNSPHRLTEGAEEGG